MSSTAQLLPSSPRFFKGFTAQSLPTGRQAVGKLTRCKGRQLLQQMCTPAGNSDSLQSVLLVCPRYSKLPAIADTLAFYVTYIFHAQQVFQFLRSKTTTSVSCSGVVPRAIHKLFYLRERDKQNSHKIKVSCYQVYCERAYDLLKAPRDPNTGVHHRADQLHGVSGLRMRMNTQVCCAV
jgi:hypothetical protein